jgi:hypothetical protein
MLHRTKRKRKICWLDLKGLAELLVSGSGTEMTWFRHLSTFVIFRLNIMPCVLNQFTRCECLPTLVQCPIWLQHQKLNIRLEYPGCCMTVLRHRRVHDACYRMFSGHIR